MKLTSDAGIGLGTSHAHVEQAYDSVPLSTRGAADPEPPSIGVVRDLRLVFDSSAADLPVIGISAGRSCGE